MTAAPIGLDPAQQAEGEARVARLRAQRANGQLHPRRLRRVWSLANSSVGPIAFATWAARRAIKLMQSRVASRKVLPPFLADGLEDPRVFIAIRIVGGIGDVVVATRWIRQLATAQQAALVIDVYFVNPPTIEFITRANGVRAVLPAEKFQDFASRYDFSLTLGQQVLVDHRTIHRERIGRHAPQLLSLLATIASHSDAYARYIAGSPLCDGAFADRAVLDGKSRKTFLSWSAGFADPPSLLPLDYAGIPDAISRQLPARYITVHDGWDTNFIVAARRPTKAYFLDQFAKTVSELRRADPQLKVVQLGTSLGEPIRGVDVDLRGQTSVAEAAEILRRASAHVDTESGLVHIATAAGTPCVVLFGPTNVAYYGYAENINLAPAVCGNCMWTTDTWMDVCPAGFGYAACMRSISPERIVESTLAIVGGRDG